MNDHPMLVIFIYMRAHRATACVFDMSFHSYEPSPGSEQQPPVSDPRAVVSLRAILRAATNVDFHLAQPWRCCVTNLPMHLAKATEPATTGPDHCGARTPVRPERVNRGGDWKSERCWYLPASDDPAAVEQPSRRVT